MNPNVTISENKTKEESELNQAIEDNIDETEYNYKFEFINEESIQAWENVLLKNMTGEVKLIQQDSEIFSINLDLPNQKVIKNDVLRTRVRDRKLLPNFNDYLESILTYYCETNEIKYKQGLNEILGPFILLKATMEISWSRLYNLFTCFVEYYLTNYFRESELYSLQSSLALVKVLLRYHDPEMHNTFEYALITPEMFATSWVLTIFANKSQLDVVYYLWNMIILENDQLLIYFIFISFLKLHRDSINNCDISLIPTYLSQMSIRSFEEVNMILSTAKKLRQCTPSSFGLIVNQLEIFKSKSDRLKELFIQFDPDNMFAMPILPSEVFYITFRDIVNCPNPSCVKHKSNELEGNCRFCSSFPNLSYILLDLRIQSDSLNNKNYSFDDKPGFLPMTVIVEQEELLLDDFAEKITERFLDEKEKYHFILITSETDYFIDYENKFYFEKISDRERFKMMYGLQTRINKEINFKVVKNSMKKDKTKSLALKLKEFDNFKNTILKFLKKNFSYISYVHGGFREIHDEALKHNIPLLNHEQDKCELCEKKKVESEKVGFFRKFFRRKEKVCLTESDTVSSILDENKSNLSLKPTYCLTQEAKNCGPTEGHNIFEASEQSYYLTIEEISSLISDPRYNVFTCLQIDTRSSKGMKNPQLMLFMDAEEIKVFKLERRKICSNSTNITEESKSNDSLSFAMIESIKVKNIICIMTRKTNKNIVTIKYTNDLTESNIVLDMITDQDAKNFILTSRKMLAQYNSIPDQS